ncbi:MAG TPA: ZIP family metal transporter [Polyangia bacterium]|jgi:ZIP family zinc transporter
MRAALIAATLTGLATGLGALPFLFVRELHRRVYDGILGLGAGLMLAAATLGLLSEALETTRAEGAGHAGLAMIVGGFIVGVALAAAMDRLIPHRHASGHHQHIGHGPGHDHHDRHHDDDLAPAHELRRGYAIIGALAIHRIPEGLAIGAGFEAGHQSRLGLLLSIAVGLQNACEGIVMAAPLRAAGADAVRSTALITLTGLATPVAALVGSSLAGATATAMPFILSLAAGTLIYVTSNEIIPESHSHGHEGTASSGVVLGFLLTMILKAVLG